MAGLVLALSAVAACLVATAMFRAATTWGGGDRRLVVLYGLAGPAAILGILLGGSLAMSLAGCPFFTPADHAIIAAVAACFLGALALAGVRQARQTWRARKDLEAISVPVQEGPLLEAAARLAGNLKVAVPKIRIARTGESLACNVGMWREKAVIVSEGLLQRLDEREIEAVLGHEIAHLAQRDHLVGFMIAWLRDSLFYWPTAREGWERYRHDRELACDALTAGATGRPGALASALFKVGTESVRLSHLLDGIRPAQARRAFLGYGILAVGVMATIMALSPVWYSPFCMTVFCKLGG